MQTPVRIIGVLALSLAALAACVTNPATGQKTVSLMSEQQEIALGRQNDQQVRQEMGVYDDPGLQKYVEQVGMALAKVSERPTLPWHFTVVDTSAVNAFALPGGFIYITRGILPYIDNEAQLAGVLGHEIGHVTARHAAQQYTQSTAAQLGLVLGSIFVPETRPFTQAASTGLQLLFLKYSRDDELQADQLGVRYESRAGWDPRGMPGLLTTLGRIEAASNNKGVPNWLETHPEPADRVQKVQAAVQQAMAGKPHAQWKVDQAHYLQQVNGIIYGDDPKQGIVRGSEFLHPGLRFAVNFPDGWTITNGEQQVVAQPQNGGAYMLLQAVTKPGSTDVQTVAAHNMQTNRFNELRGDKTSINGLPAYVGTYDGSLQQVGTVRMRSAYIRNGDQIFMVAGFTSPDSFDQALPAFDKSIQSFRPLSAAEASRIKPNLVKLYTVRSGDTWESIASREGPGVVSASTLAIMNDHAATDQPSPGQQIKIIVAG
ncbi:MAG TPA: M48 family metalloprotease [Vicinamibacterales bacterium]|jgi:predicted Zn-dependent protease